MQQNSLSAAPQPHRALIAQLSARTSVVVPAYNAALFIGATLKSVVDQSVTPMEIIVVDDGSTDHTSAIARSFGANVIYLSNRGPSTARNVGTKAAKGDYIAFLDADDIWLPEKLAIQLNALVSFGRPAFSFTDYQTFGDEGLARRRSELKRHAAFRRNARKISNSSDLVVADRSNCAVLCDSYIPPSSVIIRREDILAVGGFDENLRMTEDYEFHLRLLHLIPAVAVMKPLLLYRLHPGQATAARNALSMTSFFDVADRVAAVPGRYPAGEVQYLARTVYLRHYRLGLKQARLGEFDAAVASFRRSVTARPTVRAGSLLVAAQLCRSRFGRFAFLFSRALWKLRLRRRRPTNSGRR